MLPWASNDGVYQSPAPELTPGLPHRFWSWFQDHSGRGVQGDRGRGRGRVHHPAGDVNAVRPPFGALYSCVHSALPVARLIASTLESRSWTYTTPLTITGVVA